MRAGVVPYDEAVVAQRWLREARQTGELPDVLLLLEHPPVYTRGRRSTEDELPMSAEWYEAQGIAVRDTDRGGRVTYHGPGQLVAYPIVSLTPYGDDVHEFVRRLERVAIESLAAHSVSAELIEGLTGVWVADAKVGSIGIHVSRGVTMHGMAVNVCNDLTPFEWIVPCGIDECKVTSLSRELGEEQEVDEFATTLAARYAAILGREPVETTPEELGLDRARLGVP